MALATWRLAERRGEARLRWLAYGLGALSALVTAGLVWVIANPLLMPVPVAGVPIFNTALYVFGSGFALFVAMASMVRRSKLDAAQRHPTTGLAAAIALIDGLLGVSALNRHLFQGELIAFGHGSPLWSDAEYYGYSVAWLIYGGLILVLAIWRRLPALRHAAAGIVRAGGVQGLPRRCQRPDGPLSLRIVLRPRLDPDRARAISTSAC